MEYTFEWDDYASLKAVKLVLVPGLPHCLVSITYGQSPTIIDAMTLGELS